jgi:hypothetical protein
MDESPENHEARDKNQKTLEDENNALKTEIQRIKIQYELLQIQTNKYCEELKEKQIINACKDDITQQNNKEIQEQKDLIQQREIYYAQLCNPTMENSTIVANLKDSLIQQ